MPKLIRKDKITKKSKIKAINDDIKGAKASIKHFKPKMAKKMLAAQNNKQ
jgi:hypothetical protein